VTRAIDFRRATFRAAIAAAGMLLIATSTRAAPLEPAERGRREYVRYCASCHGVNGEGTGPVAPALLTRPPDLRRLSRRYGTPLDRGLLGAAIDGRESIVAHGDREMPVWGERFDALPPDDEARERTIAERLAALLAYLQSIQRDR
jgi:mono/diheme cytochrome c family protein